MFRYRHRTRRARRVQDSRYYRPRIEPLEDRRLLSVYVVNVDSDRRDLTDPGDGKVDVDLNTPGEQVSLRGALMDAYFRPGKNTIQFDLPGPGPHVIQPLTPFPEIRHPVTIDGYSQPGSLPNSGTIWQGHDAVIRIELDGSKLPMGADGLVITGGQSEVIGLAIHSLRSKPIPSHEELGVTIDHEGGAAIQLAATGGNSIVGNFLGANADGFPMGTLGVGVYIGCSDNVLQENIIVGNMTGVTIAGNGVAGNQLHSNYIGVGQDGMTPAHNKTGVFIGRGAHQTEIGGTAANLGNVVSANQGDGVSIVGFSPGNTVVGSNVIQNNLFGTDRTGKVIDPDGTPKSGDELGNWDSGIQITASRDNVVGLNVISGNRQSGITISDPLSQNNRLNENLIGTNIDGAKALGNELHGVEIQNAPNNVVETNVISGNLTSGVAIFGADASGNQVKNNQIGTDTTGILRVPNMYHGVQIVNAPSNDIQGNVISGNELVGVHITGITATGNRVFDNRIGTDTDGFQALGNGIDGIYIYNACDNLIGGTTPDTRNLISGNKRHGVMIMGTDAKRNQVSGNYIGTTLDGTQSLPNRRDGVRLDGAPENMIGGATAGHRNLISGNLESGIAIVGANAKKNQVWSNYIGLNEDGYGSGLGNGGDGVLIDGAPENQIGGSSSKAGSPPGNVISDNKKTGIMIFGNASFGNVVAGNVIGLDVAKDKAGNRRGGVVIKDASGNRIGPGNGILDPTSPPPDGVGESNLIVGNKTVGVRVTGDVAANSIRRNKIHDNEGLGIDLVGDEHLRKATDDVTPNDKNDQDNGPNDLLNFPVGVTGWYDGTNTYISGVMSTDHPEIIEVDVYANKAPSPTGFGQGEIYLGTVKPKESGAFHLTWPGQLPHPFLSATATASNGSTSEFSPVYGDPLTSGVVDSDGDGLPDDWEIDGVDFNGDGIVDVNLRQDFGASPRRKDLFVEFDYMTGTKPGTQPTDAAIDLVKVSFAKAPILNIDGTTGITLHVNKVSQADRIAKVNEIEFGKYVPSPNNEINDFGDLKDRYFGTAADRGNPTRSHDILGARGLVFRYAVFVNAKAGSRSSGQGDLHGDDFVVSVGNWSNLARFGGGTQLIAGTFMHELGHTLGLGHGGPMPKGPEQSNSNGQGYINYKPNYLSLMNYSFQDRRNVNRPLDYSRFYVDDLVVLDENQKLAEQQGIHGGQIIVGLDKWPQTVYTDTRGTRAVFKKASTITGIDWDLSGGSLDTAPVKAWINDGRYKSSDVGSRTLEILESREDWHALRYNFRASKPYYAGWNGTGSHGETPPGLGGVAIDDQTPEEQDALASQLDSDDDGLFNPDDNAPYAHNPDQIDSDGDGIGDAAQLASLSLSEQSVPGGDRLTATVSLMRPAPAGGLNVELWTSDLTLADVPLNVRIPEGKTAVAFPIITAPAREANQRVSIHAFTWGDPLSTELIVGPEIALSDLGVIKTVVPDLQDAPGKLTYTLTVTNHGPDPVIGVELTDTLPANVVLVSASGSAGIEQVPGPGLNVRFDYSYDTHNFFDTQEKKDLLEQAASILVDALGDDLEAIIPDGNDTWTAAFINPSTGEPESLTDLVVQENELVIFAGARDLGGLVDGMVESGRGGFGDSTASGTTEFLRAVRNRGETGADEVVPTDFARWGGQIAFNTNSDARFHFGRSTEGLDPDETDFFTVAMHEMAHVLGFGRADSWQALVDSARGVFTGPASRLEHEGDVPLDPELIHWADGTLNQGDATLMDPVHPLGTRVAFPTPLDWAGLADIGWNTDGLIQREKMLPVLERDGSVVFDVGALSPDQVITATIEVVAMQPGEVINRANVTSPYLNDPNLNNNQVSLAIDVPQAPGIVVNTTDDLDDGVADATHTSLREAINLANQLPGLDTIRFDIPGLGPHTIQPTSPLPMITDLVVIDGTTEPDYAGAPVIELDGTLAGSAANGLFITAGNSLVRGLVINRFGSLESSFTAGNGIVLDGGGNSIIEGCFLGTDVTGTARAGNQRAGILVVNSTNNLIGGVTVEARNVISGNGHAGVVLGYGAEANLVQGNYIGTTIDGDVGISATMVGVEIGGTRSNVIGGTIPEARNVISGNQIGVHLQNSQDNLVQGNYIGTTSSGSFGSGSLANFTGVLITGGAKNTIGGVGAGNVISGNQIGIEVTGPYDELSPDLYHRILGNRIGTEPDPATSLGNVLQGVRISEGGRAIVGGTGPGEGNIIAYNLDGIWCPSGEVVIRGNSIFSNARSGIFVGPELNDPDDQSPPLNYPVLGLASSDGVTTRIEGEINTPFYAIPEGGGDPIAVDVVLDFYSNASDDTTAHVEGRTYLGSWTVTAPTGPDGKPLLTTNMSFVASLPVDVPEGQRITATTFKEHRSSGFAAEITVVRDTDGDGLPDPVEDAGPSNGDANADGTPDRLQANVASFFNPVNGRSVVLEALGGATFEKVAAVPNPSPLDEPPLLTFPLGYLTFQLVVGPTASSDVVRLTSESVTDLDAVYGFGPTPDDSASHWYAFPFDGSTGAEVFTDRIDFHLADSARGDHDLTANGRIVALVAPAIVGANEGVTYVVNTADDLDDGDLQQLSLREAIIQANLHPGRDRVEFDVPPTSVYLPVRTIRPTTPLPIITDPIIIDGYTQPGSAPATADQPAVPLIELDGSLLDRAAYFPPHGHVGLHITAGHSLVQGLVINRFEDTNQLNPSVAIFLQQEGGNVVQGNFLGTPYTGQFAYYLPHGNNFGVVIDDSPNNRVGGVVPAARNLISGFYIGIDVRGERSDRNLVQGNYIGTDATGAYIPNGHLGWLGVRITDGADDNLIGGTVGTTPGGRASGAANVIAGNTYGVFEERRDGDEVPWNNTIQGNYIGTDVTGKGPLGNGYGVSIRGTGALVGGTTAAARNILSGNSDCGVEVYGGGIVQGNYIGTDVSGTRPLGNGDHGILVRSTLEDVLIGGDTPGAGNVISASGLSGIKFRGDTGNVAGLKVVIQGNFIGTDVTGTVALGNGTRTAWPHRYRAGIESENQHFPVIVGGVSPGAGNLISGNGGDGIIFYNNAYGYLVQGNLIGTDITGAKPLGNGFAGIHVWSVWWEWDLTENMIGGTDPRAANTIAFNGTEGVFLEAGKRTSILSNAIFANGTLGIDLGPGFEFDPDGVTPNDVGDEDEGTNDLQNFPLLTAARIEGGTLVEGVLDSLPDRSYRLEFFSSQVVDASGYGEGEVFLGSHDVVTDASGQAPFSVTLASVVPFGHFVTATATSPEGATSEFSQAIAVEAPMDRLDFGDAPAGFPTLLADEGARHVIRPGFYLGASADPDPDGRPSDAANGDDLDGSDDDDGVVFATPLVAGQAAVVDVTASAEGRLDAWIDFDGNGNWDGDQEQIFSNLLLLPNRNTLFFSIPASANVTDRTYARFRFSSDGGLSAGGLALDGEVEDYAVAVAAGPATPVALADETTTHQATAVAIDVVANDSDADGNLDIRSVTLLSDPTHGSAIVDRLSGVVTYIPDPGFTGTDSFTYQINDRDGLSDSAIVNVGVLPGNQPPVANDDALTTDEDTPMTIDVLANDTDADGSIDPATVAIRVGPSNGSVSVERSTGAVTYSPTPDFSGSDAFLYEVFDADGASDWAAVTVTVRAVNDSPKASDDEAITVAAVPVTIDVLANDTDPDGNLAPTTVTVTDGPTGGSVTIDPVSGEITYTSPSDFAGIATFTYEVFDSAGQSDTAVVTVEVLPANSPPEARDDEAVTDEDHSVTIDVTVNDTDPNDNLDPTTVQVVVSPLRGSVKIDPLNGTITYTPAENFDQMDLFVYQVSDTNGESSLALVPVTINPINDPPVAHDDIADTWRDAPINMYVLSNDTDIDSAIDLTTLRIETEPTSGSVVVHSDGSVQYVPRDGFIGTDQFRYTMLDDTGARSNVAVATITVQPRPPIMVVGRTFEDLDQGGPELEGPGVAGQTILLLDGQGQLISTTITQTDNLVTSQDESGWYQFPDLQPGTYIVAHQSVAGWQQSYPADQTIPLPDVNADPGVYVVTLSTTNDLEVLDFGIYRPVNGGDVSISGYVYVDVNNNGTPDPQEMRLPNVPITIEGPETRVMMTQADGSYHADHLPAGIYTITETQPLVFLDGRETLGTPLSGKTKNDRFLDVELLPGTEAQQYNFGERGLRAEFVSKWLYLASTPPEMNFLAQLQVEEGESLLLLDLPATGTLSASAQSEGEPSAIQLYDDQWRPVALATRDGVLSAAVTQGDRFMLYVGTDQPAVLNAALQTTPEANAVYRYTNPERREDVNGDRIVSPLDALLVINRLNAAGMTALDGVNLGANYLDVNADRFLSPVDALLVINCLNRDASANGEGERISDVTELVSASRSHQGVSGTIEVAGGTISLDDYAATDDSLAGVGRAGQKVRSDDDTREDTNPHAESSGNLRNTSARSFDRSLAYSPLGEIEIVGLTDAFVKDLVLARSGKIRYQDLDFRWMPRRHESVEWTSNSDSHEVDKSYDASRDHALTIDDNWVTRWAKNVPPREARSLDHVTCQETAGDENTLDAKLVDLFMLDGEWEEIKGA